MKKFDVVVLGGGPGGYVAAIRAAQHKNTSVALIEKEYMGGTCLNWGCIPTKTLIAGAEALHCIKKSEEFGIQVENVSFDFAKMTQRKDKIVANIRASLDKLIASNRITVFRGEGELLSTREIKIRGQDNEIIYGSNIILATGSLPRNVPAFPFDGERIHSSSTILDLKKLPKSLVIIGGGVIGCEFASLYRELGVKVTILEAMASIIPMEGRDVSRALSEAFLKRGIEIHTNVQVQKIDTMNDGVSVILADQRHIEAEIALVAVGRKLNTDNIGLDRAGISTTPQGAIPVNIHMETSVKGIYAIGDITAKMMLAHVASHQGIVAADNAAGVRSKMHYNAIPSVIFTHPGVATVGLSLEKALEQKYRAKIGKFPFQALGKAHAIAETEGFAQIVIEEGSNRLLGAQIVGHDAANLIAEMGLAIAQELTLESIIDTVHAHPTLAEAWLEAALMANDTGIHLPPKKIHF